MRRAGRVSGPYGCVIRNAPGFRGPPREAAPTARFGRFSEIRWVRGEFDGAVCGPMWSSAPTFRIVLQISENLSLYAVGAASPGGPQFIFAAKPQPFWGGVRGKFVVRRAGRVSGPYGFVERNAREIRGPPRAAARTASLVRLSGIRHAGRPGVRPVRVRYTKCAAPLPFSFFRSCRPSGPRSPGGRSCCGPAGSPAGRPVGTSGSP